MLRANELTDDDLLGVLDLPFWLARTGSVALGLPCTLRKALCRLRAATSEDGCPASIVRLASDDIRIYPDQIGRLQRRIGLRAGPGQARFADRQLHPAPMATRLAA
jgi:hypothetical protein